MARRPAASSRDSHRSGAFAAALELDVDDIGICHACLSFVSFAIDSGDSHNVACSITQIAPELWAEGLAEPVRMALRRARERGVANAAVAGSLNLSCAKSTRR